MCGGGHAWEGSVCGRGVCMAGQGVCMAGQGSAWQGGMCGRGLCMAGGMHGGGCMAEGVYMAGWHV